MLFGVKRKRRNCKKFYERACSWRVGAGAGAETSGEHRHAGLEGRDAACVGGRGQRRSVVEREWIGNAEKG